MKSFTAEVEDFKNLTLRNINYVMKSSISDVLIAAQTPQIGIGQGAAGFVEGKIPVDTSELINSLTVDGASGPDSYTVAIANMEPGDVKRFAWSAPHAMFMEVGFTAKNGRNVPGRHFVGRNAERFSEFVKDRTAEVRR